MARYAPTGKLVGALRELGNVAAPSGLLPAVMSRVGLVSSASTTADSYARVETPIGPLFVAFNKAGVSAVMRTAGPAEFERAFRARFGRPAQPIERLPAWVSRAISEYAESGVARGVKSTGSQHALRFDLRGLSEFERAVLLKALEIPRGEVRTYAWIAKEIGRPKAVRAVGSALGRNPVPLLIPCHRVVRSDCRIGEYGLGSDAKRAVLQIEGAEPDALEGLARSGVRYLGSATTRIYCFPTCQHARRVSERHLVQFGSAAEASAAGYRACKVCRPPLAS